MRCGKPVCERCAAVSDVSSDYADRVAAARTLRFLGSARAVDEMARRLERNDGRDSSHAENVEMMKGLFGARDRNQVIARMEEEIVDTSRPLTSLYLRGLAALRLARVPGRRSTPAQQRAAFETYGQRRLAALQRAGTLTDALYVEFEQQTWARAFFESSQTGPRPVNLGAVMTASIAAFPAETETALGRLTPARQRWMLLKGWREFTVRPFVPMLERIAHAGGAASGTAVRLLNEIDPARARRLILDDLAGARPQMAIEGAGILPERFLPSLDRRFLQQLRTATNPDQFTGALDRIERYATSSIATEVTAAYAKSRPTCRDAIPALAYFFRAYPSVARNQLGRVWTALGEADEACREGLLLLVAMRRMTPSLEDAAIAALASPDAAMIAGAAKMLSKHGSGRAEAALWRAFEHGTSGGRRACHNC